MHWTPEMDAVLIDHRPTLSASEIAKIVGNGVSRKAVIGRAWRLELPKLREKNGPDVAQKMKAKQDGPRARGERIEPKIPQLPSEPTPSRNLSIFDLGPRDCRFPTSGDGIGTMFCGHPVAGRSYCAGHHAIAYTSPRAESQTHVYVGRKGMPKSLVLAGLDAA